jgi:hypothetical protein
MVEEVRAVIEIHIGGKIGSRIPNEHIRTRMRTMLDRLPARPVTARIRFADVNGPKGGNDVRCAVLVELPGQPTIQVERLAPTPRQAFEASYDRLVRQLEACGERWQDNRRHPKKYYAARRLL